MTPPRLGRLREHHHRVTRVHHRHGTLGRTGEGPEGPEGPMGKGIRGDRHPAHQSGHRSLVTGPGSPDLGLRNSTSIAPLNWCFATTMRRKVRPGPRIGLAVTPCPCPARRIRPAGSARTNGGAAGIRPGPEVPWARAFRPRALGLGLGLGLWRRTRQGSSVSEETRERRRSGCGTSSRPGSSTPPTGREPRPHGQLGCRPLLPTPPPLTAANERGC